MPAKEDQKNPIQVIDRMARLLEVLAQHPEPLGLKQIAQYTGLHPSTAHRILSAMSADRLVGTLGDARGARHRYARPAPCHGRGKALSPRGRLRAASRLCEAHQARA